MKQLPSSVFGISIQHSFASLYLVDKLLNRHPIQQIIELGTGTGGFSAFLAAQVRYRGCLRFLSYDRHDRRRAFDFEFRKADIFSPKVVEEIRYEMRGIKTFLYCDNGNKLREFGLFVPSLKSGDLLGVHDWGTEIRFNQVERLLDGFSLLLEKECQLWGTLQRFWRRA